MKKQWLLLLGIFALAGLWNTTLQAQEHAPDPPLYEAVEWRNIGPFRGGRSCAVTGVPGQPNLFYFGATGGGVWRTQDGGQSWENISDGYFGGSIGAVAVSTYDPNVIYVGGGEKTVRGNVSFGYGIWKSLDGGKTWEQKGLEKSRHIGRIRIHPRNPDIAYAAVMGDLFKSTEERGVYRTTDGGETWERILFANQDAGAVDLILDPNNPRVIYASTWRIRRTPYSLESGGEGSALWRSTDGGDNWENISDKEGFAEGPLGIIGVTVSPVNSERVWALAEAKEGGVFRSDDGGETWTHINDSRALRQRAWYYTRIYADPQDEDVVYVMNVDYQKSKDGGKTFKAYRAPHGDHHDLWIAPEDPERMIIGDDGGAQVTFDGGENWTTYYNQPTAQFYRVTTDNAFPYRIYAAQQDNSTIRIQHRSEGSNINERHWESTAGGESAHIAVDPANNDIVYGGSYGGFLTQKNHATGEERAINVWPDNPMGYGAEGMKYRFQWNFPVFFSPHDPKKLYAASNHLHLSTDGGASWEIISPDLTRNDSAKLVSSGGPITQDNTGVEYYCTIFAAMESPHEAGVLWAGSDDGLLHLSRDGGENWEDITPAGMPEWMMINSIDADPFHKGGAYVAGTRYKLGDYKPYLYHTTDYGKSWKLIVDGIEEEHFTRVLRADPEREGLLYAGTESGMYISFDNGAHWQPFQQNLPMVPITDLTIKESNLIAATQGRGLWIIDDLSPLHQLEIAADTSAVHLFQPLPSYRMDGRQAKPSKTAGTNHPNGVMTYFYLPASLGDSAEVSVAFMEADGDLIRRFSTQAKEKANKLKVEPGSNRFVWDMQYEKAKDFEGMIMWWAGLQGPKAVPGKYRVQLATPTDTLEQTFEILKDPRISSSIAELRHQFDFMQEVNAKVSEAHQAIIDIRAVREQLHHFTKRWKEQADKEELVAQAEAIDSVMTEVEQALYQTKNRSRQDPLNYPIKLTNKLAHLNSLIAMGDFPPTQQQLQVKAELTTKIDEQLERFYALKKNDIPTFNKAVKAQAVDVIMLEE
ncbi:MAG: glycosyl hydrolase [Bacteroidetes bacterium]|jgi:photosystem II stability/assembly factor-like uncharacterized protein|nr:glycosyl hydrolase [Bacteroidota bacterium]